MKLHKNTPESYICTCCDFLCSKYSDWKRHISTAKHLIMQSGDTIEQKSAARMSSKEYICKKCKKAYKARNSLWYHENKCKQVNTIQNPNNNFIYKEEETSSNKDLKQLTTLILKMVEQNQELTKQIVELAKNSNIQNNTNINSHNKFNLNVFLNEQCKDALNISEFVSSLVITVKDLEETARLGYTDGISKIFLDGLQQLDTRKRPIHCSDLKREVFYIKDDDKWIKDNEKNDKIIKAIKHVAHKNIRMIPEWVKENPEYNDSTTKTNDQYLRLVINSMSGSTEEEQKRNMGKIVSNIAKGVVINREFVEK
jgi:hypothetical protein